MACATNKDMNGYYCGDWCSHCHDASPWNLLLESHKHMLLTRLQPASSWMLSLSDSDKMKTMEEKMDMVALEWLQFYERNKRK